MGQCATLYQISRENFEQIESDSFDKFNSSLVKNQVIFQGSFMALEYILIKGQNVMIANLITELFNPKQLLVEKDFVNLTPEEQFEVYEKGNIYPYLYPSIIFTINKYIGTISESEMRKRYDANELNKNEVYPSVWHNDNSLDKAYNVIHILKDFQKLKTFIKQADNSEDYVLVFIG